MTESDRLLRKALARLASEFPVDDMSPGPWVVERGSIAWMVREGPGGPQIGNFILEADARFTAAARAALEAAPSVPGDPDYHEHVAGDKHSHLFNGPHSHGGVSALRAAPPRPTAEGHCGDPSPHEHHDDEGTASGAYIVHTCPGIPPRPTAGGLDASFPEAHLTRLIDEALSAMDDEWTTAELAEYILARLSDHSTEPGE